jgi:four helix bundle protein
MFDFQKLEVYNKAKAFHSGIIRMLNEAKPGKIITDQLSRASLSIILNIAEGSGKFSKPDRRNFFVISRASVFECVAVLDILRDQGSINSIIYEKFLADADELSRILFSMIKNLEAPKT